VTASGVLTRLYPEIGAWTERVLWADLADFPEPDSAFDAEVGVMVRNRLAWLALQVAPASASSAALTHLRQSAFVAAAFSVEVTKAGAEVCEQLASRGFDPVVVKGPTLALAWRNPGQRAFTDLDVYVRTAQFKDAIAELERHGFAERIETALPWDAMRVLCREGTNLVRSPTERIDLHHRVPPWHWSAGLTKLVLHGERHQVTFGGLRLPAVPDEVNFLIACLHLVSDRSRPGETLIIWRDLVELGRTIDAERLASVAAVSGLGGWVRAVISALPIRTRLHDMFDLLPEQPVPYQRRLERVARRQTTLQRVPIEMLLRLPIPRAAVYAAGIALPSPRYLASRYGSVGVGLRRWWFGSHDREVP
jgi:hypothetical protein